LTTSCWPFNSFSSAYIVRSPESKICRNINADIRQFADFFIIASLKSFIHPWTADRREKFWIIVVIDIVLIAQIQNFSNIYLPRLIRLNASAANADEFRITLLSAVRRSIFSVGVNFIGIGSRVCGFQPGNQAMTPRAACGRQQHPVNQHLLIFLNC